MVKDKVRVGIIGAGFGRKAHIPGFKVWPDAEVVAICDIARGLAESVAQELGIPRVFTNYNDMLKMEELDLVTVATPPFLHHPMVMAAVQAGKHVLCEKPMALDAGEALEMYSAAEKEGVVHLVDHELRFNPTRRRMKDLIADGYIGRLRHVLLTTFTSFQATADGAPWTWWSQREKGGGRLGADGSHQIDQLRWWFGEIDGVSSRGHTFVTERKPPGSSEVRRVDSDDFTSLLVHFASGAEGVICLSSVVRHARGNRVEVYGDEGSLAVDADNRLWGARVGDQDFEDLSVPDPLTSMEGIAPNVWTRSFAHLARHLIDTIQSGGEVQQGATFLDGLRCQVVLDAAKQSWDEGRWVETGVGND